MLAHGLRRSHHDYPAPICCNFGTFVKVMIDEESRESSLLNTSCPLCPLRLPCKRLSLPAFRAFSSESAGRVVCVSLRWSDCGVPQARLPCHCKADDFRSRLPDSNRLRLKVGVCFSFLFLSWTLKMVGFRCEPFIRVPSKKTQCTNR